MPGRLAARLSALAGVFRRFLNGTFTGQLGMLFYRRAVARAAHQAAGTLHAAALAGHAFKEIAFRQAFFQTLEILAAGGNPAHRHRLQTELLFADATFRQRLTHG